MTTSHGFEFFNSIYVRACRAAGRISDLKCEKYATDELRENIELADLKVQPSEVVALTLLTASISAGLVAVAAVLLLTGRIPTFAFVLIAPAPLFAYAVSGWYPKWRAEHERVRGFGEVPQFINYLTMSMKTASNLERATQFAAENVGGSLGQRLRKLLLEVSLRTHTSVDEALVKFANRWGRWREDFKRSVYLIRSSVLEHSELRRLEVLDKALEVCLQGTREQMERFAAGLHLPTLIIYSIGVLLPLVLVAVLPVLSTVGVCVGAWHIFVIYCVVLPLVVWVLSRQVLAKRPAAFNPPEVPTEMMNWRAIIFATIAGIIAASPLIAWALGVRISPDVLVLSGLWGATLGVSIYFYLATAEACRLRSETMQIEQELPDALSQLGNRISEGRPAEDALERVAETMRGSRTCKVFERASANIRIGGLGLRAALFDEERGTLKHVYSRTVKSTLRMLVDVVQRSTRAAGDAILRIARHLKELQRVEADVRKSLGEVVSSMRSVALFFAPLIAAVTSRMQGVLTKTAAGGAFLGGGAVSPSMFLLVLGIYVVMLAAILISYSTEIEVGNDALAKRAAIAQGLPITLAVFTIGAIVGGQMLSAIVG